MYQAAYQVWRMRVWAENIGCVRGGREVLRDISLSLSSGEALLVTGRNGAGKSTLLRLLAGLLRPSAGRIGIDGGLPDADIGEQAHYLGHLDALKPSLTVAENLAFWIACYGGAGAAAPALDALGLGLLADLPAAYLSAGQRRRLSLARLIAIPRPLWLLDEPTAALDSHAQAQLTALMRTHLAGGGLIVAATHAPIGLVDNRILQIGPPLAKAPPAPVTADASC
jgi:heme exporter protein A